MQQAIHPPPIKIDGLLAENSIKREKNRTVKLLLSHPFLCFFALHLLLLLTLKFNSVL
jgi:hypothetical protein